MIRLTSDEATSGLAGLSKCDEHGRWGGAAAHPDLNPGAHSCPAKLGRRCERARLRVCTVHAQRPVGGACCGRHSVGPTGGRTLKVRVPVQVCDAHTGIFTHDWVMETHLNWQLREFLVSPGGRSQRLLHGFCSLGCAGVTGVAGAQEALADSPRCGLSPL